MNGEEGGCFAAGFCKSVTERRGGYFIGSLEFIRFWKLARGREAGE